MKAPLRVVGHFPPPTHGQSIMTRVLAGLLGHVAEVKTFDTGIGTEAPVSAPGRVRHYLALRNRLSRFIDEDRGAPVIWASISPKPSGHYRDRVAVLPSLRSQPVIAVVHWGDFARLFESGWTRHAALSMVPKIRCFVFTDGLLSECCSRWIPADRRAVIPNTLDAAMIAPPEAVASKQRARRNRPDFSMLYLSNMIETKGYLDVLEAVAACRDAGLDVRCTFAGAWYSGEDARRFADRVARYDLATRVTHLGAVHDRARVKQLHLEADAFVLPTYYPTEAQPTSIIEALSAGTPVITTRWAGIPNMVDETMGCFVDPRRPARIAEGVERLLDATVWTACSVSARRRFDDYFSPAAVTEKWSRLLERLDALE